MPDPTLEQYRVPTHIHIPHATDQVVPVLPITGLDLMAVVLVAAALVITGWYLRRAT